MTIKAETKHYPNTKSVNVVGLIEGSDPELKDEVIILGAHLDGVGYLGRLLPGALDNTSGVADIMGAIGRLKPVYYHHPLDNVEALTPEIMEDVAKLIYLGVLGLANDTDLEYY